jgi:hypothetical protein
MSLRASREGRHAVFGTCGSLRLRLPLPEEVVALGFTDDISCCLRSALSRAIQVHEVSNVRECARLLERGLGLCVVFPVPGSGEDKLGEGILRIRTQFPNVASVALSIEAHSSSRWAMRLGSAGVTELVATHSTIVPEAALLAALSRCEIEGVSARLWKRAALDVPDTLVPLLKTAIRLAHEPVSLVRLAGAARMHERTLRKYCDNSAFPSPQWIIGWARLLVAAYYMEEPGAPCKASPKCCSFQARSRWRITCAGTRRSLHPSYAHGVP